MPDLLPQSILCPVLIGRDAQVAALTRLLDLARAGQGQIALISGEAGIGKSRLVSEVSMQATHRGFYIRQGRCFETDRSLPYAPFLDLLRSLRKETPSAAALIALLSGQHAQAGEEPEQANRHRFTALADFLLDHAHSPLTIHNSPLLILEDLHWADDPSLEFLGFLARQAAQRPLLLVLTYRPDETTPGLTRLFALLDRQRISTEVTLQPLSEQETDLMVRALFQQPHPIRSEFLYTLHSLSEGNPFFIEEILKSLVATGDIFQADGSWARKPLSQLRIPRTIQAAVQSRLTNVSPAARQLLRLAAVAGRRFDFAVLQRLTGADERSQIELIKELISAQLVSEETRETFTFRHALTRQAIYSELLQRERTALHQAIGEALEQLYPAAAYGQLANLAYHFYEAQYWQKAYAYARQAGEQAQQMDAPRAALSHFSHAIEAGQRLAMEPVPYTLLYARAQAAERLGEFANARADYEAALSAARLAQEPQAEWQALLALGFLWTGRSYQQANQYFQTALQLARQTGQPAALARTLNRVGNWYLNADEPQTALAYHHEALALMQQEDDQLGVAETLDLLGTATYYSGDIGGAIVHYQATIDLCRRLDQRPTLVSALLLLAVTDGSNYLHNTLLWAAPNREAAERAGAEALTLCRTMQWHPHEAFVLAYLAWRAGAQGDYQQAFTAAQRALTIAAESEFHLVAAHLALALLYLDVGANAEASHAIEAAQGLAQQIGALMIRRFVDATQARILLAQERYAEAETVLQHACPPETPMQSPPQRLLWLAWGEWFLATNQPSRALEMTQVLIATLPAKQPNVSVPALDLLAGEALLALRRFAEAEEELQRAQAGAALHGALPLLWRIEATLAHLYRAQRHTAAAEQMTNTATAITEQLATKLPNEPLRQTLQQLVRFRLPVPKAPTQRQAIKQRYDGLTAREREVATLVAQGQTNLEIATALTLTERTVESHISNILAKLGCTNRTQIAAWAAGKGLQGDKVAK